MVIGEIAFNPHIATRRSPTIQQSQITNRQMF
jgi:hypothetical protein